MNQGLFLREKYGLSGRDKEQRQNFRALTNLFFRLGMHEGAAAPSYSIHSGGMYAARTRPRWPLPLSFFFSPRAAFHLPGVPALRSAQALSSGLQPRKRGLRPAVTEGDRKMMQLEKMKIFIFSKGVDFVNTLKTCPLSRRPYLPTVISA